MSIQQVEEYYLDFESSKFDLLKVIGMCDNSGLVLIREDGTFTVETFYSRDEAKEFSAKLINYAGIKS